MKKRNSFVFAVVLVFGICGAGFAQNVKEAEKLIKLGIEYHDQGNYTKAIEKYDKALAADKNNNWALAEKAMSLNALKKYEEAITICKLVMENNPDAEVAVMTYRTYANCLDDLGQPEKAVEMYNEGIEKYPEDNQLYYNKGVTLSGLKKREEAVICFQNAAMCNAKHASSHSAIAAIEANLSHKVPAILALSRFFIIEPQGARAKTNLELMRTLMTSSATKTGKNEIRINLDITDTAELTENNFLLIEVGMAISEAAEMDKKKRKETEAQRFTRVFGNLFGQLSSMSEEENNNGFYWDYYAPYFVEMKKKDLVETFSYLVLADSGNSDVKKWLEKHEEDVKAFYKWSNNYEWPELY